MSSLDAQHESPETTTKTPRYRTPRTHVRRAARTLRQSFERSSHELSDGFRRAAQELKNAAKSARDVWREGR